MNKQCCHCKLVKTYDDFGWRQVGDRTYIQPWCRKCRGARGKLHTNLKELVKADRERLAAIYKSDYPLDSHNRSEKYMRDKLVKRYQKEAARGNDSHA